MNARLIRLRRLIFRIVSATLRRLPLIFLAVIIFVTIFIGFKTSVFMKDLGLGQINILSFFKDPQTILGNTNGRTNFLILGIRGEGSDSPDLTDTMLVASYSYADHNITLISIPRDLWVSSLKTKINSVYHYGRFKEPVGGGIKLVQSAVLETLGLPVHYTVVIDFNLFQKAIDLVGGIDVNVATGFTDKQFPIPGKEDALPVESRYETINFSAGLQHMDGATALKFVRSRHAEGDEGTDIARDRRQQLVVTALRQKIANPNFLLNRNHLIALYQLFKENTDTNLTEVNYPAIAHLGFNTYRHQFKEIILNYQPDASGFAILENPKPTKEYLNQWVLTARDNNWPALQQYIQNKLEGNQ